jgi:hypothetical protein
MNANKDDPTTKRGKPNQTAVTRVNFFHLPLKIAGKDIRLNVSFKDAMIRFGITLFLPMIMLLLDWHLIIYTAPLMAYLFVSGITHFCIIKYVWHRYIRHEPPTELPPYGENLEYPEESV